MKRKKPIIEKKKTNRNIIVAMLACLIIVIAIAAQPTARNAAIKLANKISEITGINSYPKNNDNEKQTSDDSQNSSEATSVSTNNNKYNNLNVATRTSNNWNICFSKVIKTSVKGNASELSPVSYDFLTATFNVNLTGPTDSLTYEFTVANKGTLDAKLDSINIIPNNEENDAILFHVSGITVGDTLNAGETTKFTVIISYNNNTKEKIQSYNKNVEIIINYSQK